MALILKSVCLASDTGPRWLQLTDTPSARPSGNTDWQATTNLMQMYADGSEGESESKGTTQQNPLCLPDFPARLQASDAALSLCVLTSRFTLTPTVPLPAQQHSGSGPAMFRHCVVLLISVLNISSFVLLRMNKGNAVKDSAVVQGRTICCTGLYFLLQDKITAIF